MSRFLLNFWPIFGIVNTKTQIDVKYKRFIDVKYDAKFDVKVPV